MNLVDLEQRTYSSGVWLFEGHGYVPAGTTGASVMQVFGAAGPPRNTTLMLHVYGGRLVYYRDWTKVVDGDIYDRWFRLNQRRPRRRGVGAHRVRRRPAEAHRARLRWPATLLQVRGVHADGPLALHGVKVEGCQGVQQDFLLKNTYDLALQTPQDFR
jgi:hypothetical protein